MYYIQASTYVCTCVSLMRYALKKDNSVSKKAGGRVSPIERIFVRIIVYHLSSVTPFSKALASIFQKC